MHQLEILDKRITFNTYRIEYQRVKKTWWRVTKNRQIQEVPMSIGWLTIRELLYILQSLQINYLKECHIFYIRKKSVIVRVYDPEPKEKDDEEKRLPLLQYRKFVKVPSPNRYHLRSRNGPPVWLVRKNKGDSRSVWVTRKARELENDPRFRALQERHSRSEPTKD